MKKTIITIICVIFVSALFGQPQVTHWTQPTNYESNMNVNSIIFIENVEQNSEYLEIGAFCGNECRGCALPAGMVEGHALYLLTISANADGEDIIFRLFDHQTNQELSYECTETMTFTADMVLGAYPDFHPFHFTPAAPPQATHWTQPMNFQSNMSVSSTIYIEGIEQNSEFLEIGAFCGNECRGCALPVGMVDGHALYLLTISANEDGEIITFRLYNHWMGLELPHICTETMAFATDMVIGAYPDFHAFHFVAPPSIYHFTTPGSWSEASNWSNNTLPHTNALVFVDAACQLDQNATVTALIVSADQSLTLQSGNTLTVTSTLTNTVASGLVIKDGAQLINASSNVAATMEKHISAYAGASTGWYTIASPMAGMPIANSDFLTPSYDLYRFNGINLTNEEWENYKANFADFTTFEKGRGYLYANENDFTPTFTGILNSSAVTYDLNYINHPNDPQSGFNLIGNPFPHEIYKGTGGAIDNPDLASGYYTLTNEGTWQVHSFDDAIQPGQGILVRATAATNLTISKTNAAAGAESGQGMSLTDRMEIRVSGERGEDCCFVYFGQGNGLEKMEHLSETAPSLSILTEDRDYAIAHLNKPKEPLKLLFASKQADVYTLTVKCGNCNFDYLHLIDKETGADVDLLQQSSYSFRAADNEYGARFVIVF